MRAAGLVLRKPGRNQIDQARLGVAIGPSHEQAADGRRMQLLPCMPANTQFCCSDNILAGLQGLPSPTRQCNALHHSAHALELAPSGSV